MSRTFKDRPWRVRSADPSEEREPFHNHRRFGDEVHIYHPVMDEDGKPVMKTVDNTFLHYEKLRNEDGSFTTVQILRTYTHTYPQKEAVLVGVVPNYCTLEENRTAILDDFTRWNLVPCGYNVTLTRRNRPHKWEKQGYHGAARRAERDSLRKAVKAYNAEEDLEAYSGEYDNKALYNRANLHRGGWH